MAVSNIEKPIGKCPICEINVYDRGSKNKPFKCMGKTLKGYPRDVSMPCGIDRTNQLKYDDPAAKAAAKEMTKDQFDRCPFESKEQQDQIEYKKSIGVISGENTWDGIA